MNEKEETRFVRSFIRKDRQERLLYELTTPEKRYRGVSRFCHRAGELLDRRTILLQGEDLDRRPEFRRFVERHDAPCLVLSPDFDPDEQWLPLKAAVDRAVFCCDAVLILGNDFAVVFGEPDKGGREKYLLSETAEKTDPL